MKPGIRKIAVCYSIAAALLFLSAVRCGTGRGSPGAVARGVTDASAGGTEGADTVFALADYWPPAAGTLHGIGDDGGPAIQHQCGRNGDLQRS